eukprot:m.180787 g.180787  ORF g.180787 m.180787 type:complete len:754 (-) comp14656_c0_seq2:1484-3745(-)
MGDGLGSEIRRFLASADRRMNQLLQSTSTHTDGVDSIVHDGDATDRLSDGASLYDRQPYHDAPRQYSSVHTRQWNDTLADVDLADSDEDSSSRTTSGDWSFLQPMPRRATSGKPVPSLSFPQPPAAVPSATLQEAHDRADAERTRQGHAREVNDLRQQLSAAQLKVKQVQQQLAHNTDTYREELARLRRQAEMQLEARHARDQQHQKEHARELVRFQQQSDKKQVEVAALQTELGRQQEQMAAKQDEVDSWKKETLRLQAYVVQLQQQDTRLARLTALEEELSNQNAKCLELASVIDKATGEYQTLEAELKITKARLHDSEQQVSLLQKDNTFLEKDLAHAKGEKQLLESQVSDMRSAMLRQRDEVVEIQHKEEQARVQERQEFETRMHTELQQLRANNKLELDEIKRTAKDIQLREVEMLRKERDYATDMRQKLESEVETLRSRLAALDDETRQTSKAQETMVATLQAQEKIKSFEAERSMLMYEEAKSTIAALQADNDRHQQKEKVLREEYYALKAQTDAAVESMRRQIADQKEQLSAYSQLEQELDGVLLQTAESAGAQELLLATTAGSSESGMKRRVRQSITLARQLLAAQKETQLAQQKVERLEQDLTKAHRDLTTAQALLDSSTQPYSYMFESLQKVLFGLVDNKSNYMLFSDALSVYVHCLHVLNCPWLNQVFDFHGCRTFSSLNCWSRFSSQQLSSSPNHTIPPFPSFPHPLPCLLQSLLISGLLGFEPFLSLCRLVLFSFLAPS